MTPENEDNQCMHEGSWVTSHSSSPQLFQPSRTTGSFPSLAVLCLIQTGSHPWSRPVLICKATCTPLAFNQEQLDSCINWPSVILKCSKRFRVGSIPFVFRQCPACTTADINPKIYSNTVSQKNAVINAFQSFGRNCTSLPWRHRPPVMNMLRLQAPLPQGWLYRGVVHSVLPRTHSFLVWRRRNYTSTSFLHHFGNLSSTRCMCKWWLGMQHGWAQRAHFSFLFSHLQSTVSFLHVSSVFEKNGETEVLATPQGCTSHWKYLLQEIPPCIYETSISQDELPVNIWKMSPSTYS